jgi:hypothetical protein
MRSGSQAANGAILRLFNNKFEIKVQMTGGFDNIVV